MLKHVIQSNSTIGYEAALNIALEEAAAYASALHDAHITVTDLSFHEETGYYCTVEVTLSAIGLTIEGDEVLSQQADQDYRVILTQGRKTLRQFIADFLAKSSYVNLAQLPDFILSRLTPEDLLNKIVIQDFQEAVEPDAPPMAKEFTEAIEMTANAAASIPPDEEPRPELE